MEGKNDGLEGQGVILRGWMRLEESAEKAELEQLQYRKEERSTVQGEGRRGPICRNTASYTGRTEPVHPLSRLSM